MLRTVGSATFTEPCSCQALCWGSIYSRLPHVEVGTIVFLEDNIDLGSDQTQVGPAHSACQQTSLSFLSFFSIPCDAPLPTGWWGHWAFSHPSPALAQPCPGLISQVCRHPPSLPGSLHDYRFPLPSGPSSASRGKGSLWVSFAYLCLLCSFTYSFNRPVSWDTKLHASGVDF